MKKNTSLIVIGILLLLLVGVDTTTVLAGGWGAVSPVRYSKGVTSPEGLEEISLRSLVFTRAPVVPVQIFLFIHYMYCCRYYYLLVQILFLPVCFKSVWNSLPGMATDTS